MKGINRSASKNLKYRLLDQQKRLAKKTMDRINLNVSSREKEDVKSLGAKWDKEKKTWYTYYGDGVEKFFKWILPKDDDGLNLQADYFYIAEVQRECWKCKKETKVYSFLLEFFQVAETIEEMEGNDHWKDFWVEQSDPSFISNITKLNKQAQMALLSFTDKFKMSKSNYYGNHCERCNALQGDFYLHVEPGVAFFPTNEKEIKNIKLYKIDEPFFVSGSYSWNPTIFDDFKIIKLCLQKPKKRRFSPLAEFYLSRNKED